VLRKIWLMEQTDFFFHRLLAGKRQAVDKPPKEQKYLKDNKSPQTRLQ